MNSPFDRRGGQLCARSSKLNRLVVSHPLSCSCLYDVLVILKSTNRERTQQKHTKRNTHNLAKRRALFHKHTHTQPLHACCAAASNLKCNLLTSCSRMSPMYSPRRAWCALLPALSPFLSCYGLLTVLRTFRCVWCL